LEKVYDGALETVLGRSRAAGVLIYNLRDGDERSDRTRELSVVKLNGRGT
jgi:hypothetical protein